MKPQNKYNGYRTSVYLMLLLSLALAAIIFYIVGSNQKLFDRKYSIYMFMPDVQSLIPGAFITLSGLKVGVVGKMEFDTYQSEQGIKIELKIDRDYKKYVTRSSMAQIKTMGILGDKYVEISLGKAGEPPLPEGSIIRSIKSINMDQAMADAAASLTDLKQVVQNLKKLTQRTVNGQGTVGQLINDPTMAGNLKTTLHNAKSISDNLRSSKGNVGKLLQDSSLYQAFLNTTKQLEAITNRIAKGEGSVGKAIADTSLYGELKSIAIQTDSLMKKLNGNGTVGTLIKDKKYYDELLGLTRQLRELAEDIKNHPEKYGSFKLF